MDKGKLYRGFANNNGRNAPVFAGLSSALAAHIGAAYKTEQSSEQFPRVWAGGYHGASFNLDFVNQVYAMGAVGSSPTARNLADILNFTRATGGGRFNAAGQYEWVAANVLRLDYDPVTLQPRGFLCEGQRTNLISRSSGAGAVAGSPGTLPTGWSYAQVPGGCTAEVVGVGSVWGLGFVDIRVYGTTTNSNAFLLQLSPPVSVGSGEHNFSCYLAVTAGSAAAYGLNGGGGVGAAFSAKTLSGSLARYNATWNLTAGTLSPWVHVSTGGSGVSIDVTLRLAAPQLEYGASPSSFILTTSAQVTRAADLASTLTISPWFNPRGGTLYAEASPGTLVVPDGAATVAALTASGSINERIIASQFLPAGIRAGAVGTGGADVALISAPGVVPAVGVTAKSALSYEFNNVRGATNGILGAPDNTAGLATVEILHLGILRTVQQFNGHIRAVRYYPRPLKNSELQQITA